MKRIISFIPNKIVYKLNDINMRAKILILYIFCVMLPIISINMVFYFRISENLHRQELNNINLSMERISENVLTYVEDLLTISHILHVDRSLYEGIERRYPSFRDFYSAYEQTLSFTLNKYFPIFPHLENLIIYNSNETIGNAGVFRLITDETRNESWYEFLYQNPTRLLMYVSFIPDPFAPNVLRRRLSLIRQLNHFPAHFYGVEKILRIDLRFEIFSNLLKDENIYGSLFVLNENDQIVYSSDSTFMTNTNGGYIHTFDPALFDSQSTILYKNFNRFIRDWRVVTVLPPQPFYEILREARLFVILFTLGTLIICTFITLALSKSLTKRLSSLTNHIKNLRDDNLSEFEYAEGKDEIGRLIVTYNIMVQKLKKLVYDVYESNIQRKNMQIERKQAQVNALQSQINPHFLFNSLETIRMRSLLKNETETAEIIKSLSKTFRKLLHWSNDLIPIEEEIGFIKDFLNIQKYRFGDKFNFDIIIDEDVKSLSIPKMTIQPLIENSCIHGIEKSKNPGDLLIQIKRNEDLIVIHVSDNGKGMDKSTLANVIKNIKDEKHEGKSIGIRNVYARLKLIYKDNFHFNIESMPDIGTEITIILPLSVNT